MNKTIPEYITALSNSDLELLEKLMCKKYRKLRDFYYLISKYHDYLKSITYKETKDDELKINVVLSRLKTEKVIKELKESVPYNSDVTIKKSGKEIQVIVRKVETT